MELKWLNVLPSVLVLLHLHVSVVLEDPISSARAVLDVKKLCYNQTMRKVSLLGINYCIFDNIAYSYPFIPMIICVEHNLFDFGENVVFAFAVQRVASFKKIFLTYMLTVS